MELLLWVFQLTIKSVYSIKFSLPNMRLKDTLTVMTAPPMHSSSAYRNR